jgi:ParB/RepB/Spo0J family partition protein
MQMNTQTTELIIEVPLDKIVHNRYQPRTTMDPAELATLADSIKRNGMMQKPTARFQEDGCHELAFGHRRFEAYKLLAAKDPAYKSMPLIVRELDDRQMFEFAWEENQEREDINPVDQGEAYANYMRVFSATSKQAGEYFRVSEETIRQKMRYGKLPEPIKEKMRAGEVNENTARSLLSMQKVASEEALVKTVQKIEKQKGDYTPDAVIKQEMYRLDNVVNMWRENYDDGKPRAGYHGWPLDMKKFPNHLMPAMTVEAVGTYEKHIEHLANPPACTACPFYTKAHGTHFCGLKVCFERKIVAWQRYAMEQASKQTGIEIYDDEDGAYRKLESYGKNVALFVKKHKGLRLVAASEIRQSVYQGFKGLDDDLVVVVATGEALDKLNNVGGQTKGGKRTEAEKAEMRMMEIYRARRKQLIWEFAGVAKSILAGVPYAALLEMKGWKFVGVDDNPPADVFVPDNAKVDAAKADYFRRLVIWRMVFDDSSHYRRKSMASMLNDFEKHAKEWGIKIPKSLVQQAEKWDAEIKAAGERKPK